jgi:stage IV sporulation protein FB
VNIFFVPLVGAFASGTKENVSQRQSIIMLLAGPMPGVFIGVILYYFGLKDESNFLIRSANIFIFLNLFNLLPVMPLDGGRIIKSLFFEANELVGKIFIIISIALLTLYAFYAESYFILIVPFFLLIQLNSQSQSKNVQVSVEAKGIDLRKSFSELSNEEYWLIRDEVGKHMSYFKQFITPGEYRISEGEQKIIRQVKEILSTQTTQDLSLIGKILVVASILVAFFAPFVLIGIFQVLLQA